jgi:hypothetical protein
MSKDKKQQRAIPEIVSAWSNKPLDETGRIMYEVRRCKPGKPVEGIILSDTLLGKYTHHMDGRTQPHVDGDCRGCARGISMRWHSWIFCKDFKSPAIFIMEFPAIGANQMYRFEREYGGLRGYSVKQIRVGTKENGRIRLQEYPDRVSPLSLPPCPDIVAVMSKMWEIRPDQVADNISGGNILLDRDQLATSADPKGDLVKQYEAHMNGLSKPRAI